MKKTVKKILSAMAVALAIVALATAPTMAKSSKNANKHASPSAAAVQTSGSVPEVDLASHAGQRDTKPGLAWKTVGGKVTHIKGNTYTVEDYEGNQVQLYVGQGTKHIRGNKKVGDTVRAEITRGGFANSIQ